jgi:hypothetical protein
MVMRRLQQTLAAFIGVGVLVLSCTAAQAGLIAYWTMNDGEGTSVSDSSGNGHAATLNGSWSTGKIGGAVSIASSSSTNGQYVDCGTASSLSPGSGDFTFSAWINGMADTSGYGWRTLFCYAPNTASEMSLSVNDGTLRGMGGSSYSPLFGQAAADTPDCTKDKWYHIALTRSGSTFKAYIDGVQYGYDGTYSGSVGTGLCLGNFYNTYEGTHRQIAMDDVAIWNQALTSDQVSQLAAGTLSPAAFATPEPGTMALAVSGLLGLLVYAWRKRQ